MKNKQTRARLQPFRLLVMLCDGTYGWLSRDGRKFTATTAALSRLLKVSSGRLDDMFAWLLRMGYLTAMERTRGKVTGEVKLFKSFEETSNVKANPSPTDRFSL